MIEVMDTLTRWSFLQIDDLAGKLTPTRGVPDRTSSADQVAIDRLLTGRILVDPDAGVICKSDGISRAETPRPDAYGMVYLGRVAGKVRWARAHRIVWIAARGPIPGMYEVNHRNGLRWDNRIENLDLVTHANNCAHAARQPYEHIPAVPFLGEDDRSAELNVYATGSIINSKSYREI